MSFTALVMLYNNTEQDDFYRQLALQVLKNIRAVSTSSSYQLAELCYASPSAIRKLAKKLGYDSYSDFKAGINWQLTRYLEIYRHTPGRRFPEEAGMLDLATGALSAVIANVRNEITEEQIEQAAEAILSKPRVSFFTMKGSPIQNVLQQDLILLGKEVTMYSAMQDQALGAGSADGDTAAILIKMDMIEPSDMRMIARTTKERSAVNIIISNANPAWELEYCDHALWFNGAVSLTDMYAIDLILQAISMTVRKHIK